MSTSTQAVLNTAAAHALVASAVAHAASLGIRINVAVVDAGGVLLAFLRMNGAFLHSVDIAIDKAYTSASFGFATAQWADIFKHDEALKIGMPQRPRLVTFGGGLPIVHDGACIGGIGVSGGSAEQDEACAQAALSTL